MRNPWPLLLRRRCVRSPLFPRLQSAVVALSQSFVAAAKNVLAYGTAYRVITALLNAGPAFVTAALAIDQVTHALASVTGSAARAAKEFTFLQGLAEQTGTGLDVLTQQWLSLQATAAQTPGRLVQVRDIFTEIIDTSARLNKTTEQVGLALYGFTQIVGGTTLQLQDFNQMIDALPGLMPALAKELGVTPGRIRELTRTGQVLVDDLLPAFGRAVNSLASGSGPIHTLQSKLGRLNTAWLLLSKSLSDAGAMDLMIFTVQRATFVLRDLRGAIDFVRDGWNALRQVLGRPVR